LDDVDDNKVVDFEHALQTYMKTSQSDLVGKIDATGDYDEQIAQALHAALKDFKANHTW
jgi:F-type H+-transporting ATPase subunit alpha